MGGFRNTRAQRVATGTGGRHGGLPLHHALGRGGPPWPPSLLHSSPASAQDATTSGGWRSQGLCGAV